MMQPHVLFEISWEVCNMVGGIHTVLASKAHKMRDFYGDGYISVGPEISHGEAIAEFSEDAWNPLWADALTGTGVGVRMGRWLVPGEPRCLLIDFSPLYSQRDAILAEYWEKYRLDSLFGGWDYVEPILFAHGAGLAIAALANKVLLPEGKSIVIHAHEWMSAGAIFHLKSAVPEIGSVFTTHATALGRSLATFHPDIYADMTRVDPDAAARAQGILAKHSAEKTAAAQSDCFTTVSEITAEECRLLLHKEPDLLVPNALGDDFPPPQYADAKAVTTMRRRLLELATCLSGQHYDEREMRLFMSAGRYEFVNKGVDLYIEGLARLAARLPRNKTQVVAYLFFPADHSGPRRDLLQGQVQVGGLCTHDLRDPHHDPILRRLREHGFDNSPGKPVHVVYVPIYLDGNDPLVPELYYQFLAAMDLTVFPSYYEPWGYTPMESIGYGVPTISSDRAGFGLWAASHGGWFETGVNVLARHQATFEASATALETALLTFLNFSAQDIERLREAARRLGRQCRWESFGQGYFKAHRMALLRAQARVREWRGFVRRPAVRIHVERPTPHRREFVVHNRLPQPLERLRELASNLWWTWQPDAAALFAAITDNNLSNPLTALDYADPTRLEALAHDETYLQRLDEVWDRFTQHMRAKQKPVIAYFCAEFGLAPFLPIYAGGLGVLAGDYLKAAADNHVPICGIGLFYKYGYFKQRLHADGQQEALRETIEPRILPLRPVLRDNGHPRYIAVPMPGGAVQVRAWAVAVGNVDLYLLDTDVASNRPEDRAITDQLYGGDAQHRLRQELILGIGGVRLLRVLGIEPKVFHMNEGHSAFLIFARLATLIEDKALKFHEALDYVQETSVFTTHTPVPAGHDTFPEDLVRPYLAWLEKALRLDWPHIVSLGQAEGTTEFSMTNLGVQGSKYLNAVSQTHASVARRSFQPFFPGFHEQEIPVLAITNGVHVPTWLAPTWQRAFDARLGPMWRSRVHDEAFWSQIRIWDDATVWQIHTAEKSLLVETLKRYCEQAFRHARDQATSILQALKTLERGPMILGFARRFAPYKRATLLFRHPDRLATLLQHDHPIVIVFAGKAHPQDHEGQRLLHQIVELSQQPEFRGKILFLPGYDMALAQRLVAGSDVWLNTPAPPLEASGTSGMKAGINGCLNLSVADGWWVEGYNELNGWSFSSPGFPKNPALADESDAAQLYALLEDEVIPEYFALSGNGYSQAWVRRMKESIASILPRFSMERVLHDYQEKIYQPATLAADYLAADGYAHLYESDHMKALILRHWEAVTFRDVHIEGLDDERMLIGETMQVQVVLTHPELPAELLVVEAVLSRQHADGTPDDLSIEPLQMEYGNHGESRWVGRITCRQPGHYSLGLRVVPRKDRIGMGNLRLMRWL